MLVDALDHWANQEISTQEFADKYSFVRPSPKAIAFDNNTEVEYTWNLMLSDETMGLVEFVELAMRDEVVGKLFPFTSLYTLCFSRCTGYPYDTENLPNVTAKQFGYFTPKGHKKEGDASDHAPDRVYIVTKNQKEYIGEGNAEEALRIVRANLPGDISAARRGVAY